MTATIRLWWLLRRRTGAGAKDPTHLTSWLAIAAFAVTAATALVVVGGLLAFQRRAHAGVTAGTVSGASYVMLAAVATLLLLVPLATLGAAAARLSMARRDARLAALRLAGATTGQVTVLTLLDAALQAVAGSLLGIGLYLAALPLVALLSFQARTFELGELWVGVGLVLLTVLGVVVVAVGSAAVSLRRVVVTPLGVAARTSRPGLRPIRVLALVAAIGAAMVGSQLLGLGGEAIVVLVFGGFVALGMATLNLIGPLVLQVAGRVVVGRARGAATLLASRRIIDDPKAAWRCVGGVALASFIAGLTSMIGMLSGMSVDPDQQVFLNDLVTGGLLTLGIAGVLAAVSTGVMQAGRVIDQRQEYRNLVLAGTDLATLDKARLRETSIPLLASMGVATVTMLLIMVPLVGVSVYTAPAVLALYVTSVAATAVLVLLGAWATRFVARQLTADLVG